MVSSVRRREMAGESINPCKAYRVERRCIRGLRSHRDLPDYRKEGVPARNLKSLP